MEGGASGSRLKGPRAEEGDIVIIYNLRPETYTFEYYCRYEVRTNMKRERSNTTYLAGAGEEAITAFSKTIIEELGGFCTAGISAVKTTAWGASVRPSIVARTLPDGAVG